MCVGFLWFVGCCFRGHVLPSKLEKAFYRSPRCPSVGKLDASILFVQVFVEFIDFVFVYSRDCIVNVT